MEKVNVLVDGQTDSCPVQLEIYTSVVVPALHTVFSLSASLFALHLALAAPARAITATFKKRPVEGAEGGGEHLSAAPRKVRNPMSLEERTHASITEVHCNAPEPNRTEKKRKEKKKLRLARRARREREAAESFIQNEKMLYSASIGPSRVHTSYIPSLYKASVPHRLPAFPSAVSFCPSFSLSPSPSLRRPPAEQT